MATPPWDACREASSTLITLFECHPGTATWIGALLTPISVLAAIAAIIIPGINKRREDTAADQAILEEVPPLLKRALELAEVNVSNHVAHLVPGAQGYGTKSFEDVFAMYEGLREELDKIPIAEIRSNLWRNDLRSARRLVRNMQTGLGARWVIGPTTESDVVRARIKFWLLKAVASELDLAMTAYRIRDFRRRRVARLALRQEFYGIRNDLGDAVRAELKRNPRFRFSLGEL
jgi:hypothetical protein